MVDFRPPHFHLSLRKSSNTTFHSINILYYYLICSQDEHNLKSSQFERPPSNTVNFQRYTIHLVNVWNI